MGIFGGKVRQETISKKQPISLDFWGANLAKIDQFCIDMTSVVNVFFNRDNHLLFQQQFAREMSEGIMVSAQFFATLIY